MCNLLVIFPKKIWLTVMQPNYRNLSLVRFACSSAACAQPSVINDSCCSSHLGGGNFHWILTLFINCKLGSYSPLIRFSPRYFPHQNHQNMKYSSTFSYCLTFVVTLLSRPSTAIVPNVRLYHVNNHFRLPNELF
jgi:hypothetical protein